MNRSRKLLRQALKALCQACNTAPSEELPQLIKAICEVHRELTRDVLFFAVGVGLCVLLEVVTYFVFRVLV